MDVLRYELETFVCNGQYKRGMEDILETYLKNIGETQQPAAWVSGFMDLEKSHLRVKKCSVRSGTDTI